MPKDSYDQIEEEVSKRFNEKWTVEYPNNPIVWDNVVEKTHKSMFARFSIRYASSEKRSLGTNLVRKSGVVTVEIIEELDRGTGDVMRAADFVEGVFEHKNINGVQFYSSRTIKAGRIEGIFKVAVLTSFYFDLLRS